MAGMQITCVSTWASVRVQLPLQLPLLLLEQQMEEESRHCSCYPSCAACAGGEVATCFSQREKVDAAATERRSLLPRRVSRAPGTQAKLTPVATS